MPHRTRPAGFTLIELLIVISVLALLASVGSVSYDSVRQYARDVKRVADMDSLQTALELFYQDQFTYPADAVPGGGGTVLGSPNAVVLDAGGFADVFTGKPYLAPVPANPAPGGAAYLYRSFNADGSDCDRTPCARYVVSFAVDGNIGDLAAGPHAVGSEGIDADASGQLVGGFRGADTWQAVASGGAGRAVFFFREQATELLDAPVVEQGATQIALPAVTLASIFATARAVPFTELPRIFLYFFGQPILYFLRPRRRGVGVIYHALSKAPIDLVVARLRDLNRGVVVRSSVTSRTGRFQFIVPKGRYQIEVSKPGFVFPSVQLRDYKTDGAYSDVYHGEPLVAHQDGAILSPSIPLDPVIKDVPDYVLLRLATLRTIKHVVAVSGVITSAATFLAVPTVAVGAVAVAHTLLYLFFRRVSIPPHPREWGIVYEEGSPERSVSRAVVRMFALPYHKLVDTQVTDQHGRYSFLIGPAEVYLTVTKNGFVKTETDPIDLRSTPDTHVVAGQIPLRRTAGGAEHSVGGKP